MKKNSIYVLILAVGFLMSACGSNSKEDPLPPPPSPPNYNGYVFENATNSLLINSYKEYEIKFQLTKDGFPAAEEVILFKSFSKMYGSVSTYKTTTDKNGRGLFIYNPPAIIPDNNTNVELQYVYLLPKDNNETFNDLLQNVILHFNYDASNGNGRATTLSLVYVSTSSEPGKMINRYLVHAVDKKSNQPKVGIPVSMSLVNNVKVVKTDKEDNSGNIIADAPPSFHDSTVEFVQSKVEVNDNLIIFPSEDKVDPSYIGGWNIDGISSSKLILSGVYSNLNSTNKLYYVIGDERRLIGDEGIGQIGVADVKLVDGETETNVNGDVFFDVTFDSILAGHTVTLEAHGTDNGERIGIAKRAGLRWGDFSASPVAVSNNKNKTIIKEVKMNLTINTEGGGSEWLVGTNIVPSSFTVVSNSEGGDCIILLDEPPSDFFTGNSGQVIIAVKIVDTNVTNKDPIDCTVNWKGGMSSIYSEY